MRGRISILVALSMRREWAVELCMRRDEAQLELESRIKLKALFWVLDPCSCMTQGGPCSGPPCMDHNY